MMDGESQGRSLQRLRRYGRRNYFKDNFPFAVEQVSHHAAVFNSSLRFQREFWKISRVVTGRGFFLVNDEAYPIQKGSVMLVHPDAVTTYQIEEGPLVVDNIVFLPMIFAGELNRLWKTSRFFEIFSRRVPESSELYVQSDDRLFSHLIETMRSEYEQKKLNYQTVIKSLLLVFLIQLARGGEKRYRQIHTPDAVERIGTMIENDFSHPLTLADFEKKTGIDRTRLCQLYRQCTGETIMSALRRRRLREARELLRKSEAKITEICFRCGFGDLSHFYRQFRCETGMTPQKFRKSAVAKIEQTVFSPGK